MLLFNGFGWYTTYAIDADGNCETRSKLSQEKAVLRLNVQASQQWLLPRFIHSSVMSLRVSQKVRPSLFVSSSPDFPILGEKFDESNGDLTRVPIYEIINSIPGSTSKHETLERVPNREIILAPKLFS